MNFLRDTLYCALNNTKLEDIVILIDKQLHLWPQVVWEFPDPPMIKWRWETIEQPDGKMRHVLCYGPDGTELLKIVRYKSSEVNYDWFVFNPKKDPTDRAISFGTFYIEAERYQQDRVEITIKETDGTKVKNEVLRWLEQHWPNQYEELPLRFGKRTREYEPWWLPTEPPVADHEGYTRDDVFDWWHRGGKMFIPELQNLSHVLGVASSTVHNLHSDYLSSYPSKKKPDAESHFAGMFIPPVDDE